MATLIPALRQAQPQGIELVQQSYLEWQNNEEAERQRKYRAFRDFYDGDHETLLTARMRRFLELKAEHRFNLNFCPIVVDSLAEKLKVASFTCEDDSDVLNEWWAQNRMDAVQAVVHLATIRDGDSYLLTEWDNDLQRPRWTHENAYDGTDGVYVVYSSERRSVPLVAVKRWIIGEGTTTTVRRANLYFPDRIEKYADSGNGWTHFSDDGEDWPVSWTAADGSPLGIPVVHFRNKDQGYSHGLSELDNVAPVQNGLNKTFIDLLASADSAGFPMYTATGYDGEANSTTVAPGMLLWSTDPGAKFGAISPTDLSGIISLVDSISAYIAKITRTPLSFFQLTGQVAAAGTLKEQRSGLISKALDRQVTFGDCWEDAVYMARRLCNTFAPAGVPQFAGDAEVSVVWVDDEKPDQNELADTVNKMALAHAASTETKVKTLHPEWDQKAVDVEVKLIRGETGVSVSTLPPLATMAEQGT